MSDQENESEVQEISICKSHPEYQVPLIWTMAFMGAECWCPYCGKEYGMFGDFTSINKTQELLNRADKYKEFSKEFLRATGVPHCSSTIFNGERVTPDQLPKEEHERMAKIRDEWKYNIKAEEV